MTCHVCLTVFLLRTYITCTIGKISNMIENVANSHFKAYRGLIYIIIHYRYKKITKINKASKTSIKDNYDSWIIEKKSAKYRIIVAVWRVVGWYSTLIVFSSVICGVCERIGWLMGLVKKFDPLSITKIKSWSYLEWREHWKEMF